MVVGSGLVPVGLQVLEVKVEALYFGRSLSHHVHGCLAEADWSQSRRGAQTLLGGAIANVYAPVVHPDFVPAQ